MEAVILNLFLCIFTIILCAKASEFHQGSSKLLVYYNITCDPNFEENCQSESLETIAAKIEDKYDLAVQININTSWLKLNSAIKFRNFRSLAINGAGHGESTTIICKGTDENENNIDAGIVLSDIADRIMLSNLKLTSCGSKRDMNQSSDTYCTGLSALTILHCNNVELRELIIERSVGTGLMILHHSGGRVSIISMILKENKPPQNHSMTDASLGGGGGVCIEFSNEFPVTLQFENCTFVNNTASHEPIEFGYGYLDGNDRNGGGIYMYIKNGSHDISASFLRCNFSANQAYFGGGMSVNINNNNDHMTNNVSVTIEDSYFEHNGCWRENGSYFGGGLGVKFSSTDLSGSGSGVVDCHFLVENVTFIDNHALIGGAMYYYSYHGRQPSDYAQSSIQFDACSFKHNRGHVGSAFAIIPDIFLKTFKGYKVIPTFTNCHFLNNGVFTNRSQFKIKFIIQSIPGIGTIYASLSDINFEGHNIFENNWGTAVYVVNGILNFQNSNATFINNTGLQGGAVALIGFSKMIIGQNNYYEFINNHAKFLGGAIFVSLTDITDFLVSKSCFIQNANYDITYLDCEWKANVTVTFTGNKAKDGGHAIYATSLSQCRSIKHGTENISILDVFVKLRGFTFDDDVELQPQVQTDEAMLSVDERNIPLMIIPGENYRHGVVATDDLDQKVEASFRVDITDTSKETSVQLDPAFSTIIDDEVQLVGDKGQNATLYLETLSARQIFIKLNFTLLDCPPGFKLNESSKKCDCNSHNYLGLLRCNEDDFNSYLITGFWVGYIESELVTSVCPFCDYGPNVSMSSAEVALTKRCDHSKLDKLICGDTRTGVLCGECRDGYTVHFHSPDFMCKLAEPAGCKFGWLFYILSELVPVTLFLLIVLALNISFTSGAINGFILFSQLLCSLDIIASGIITFPESGLTKAIQGYQTLYGFFNLDFEFFPFCFWTRASALDMIAVKYITILYTMLMIVVVIWIMNKCGGRWLNKWCRITTIKTSITHGMSTFLMISYAQCIKVSLSLLRPAYIHTEYNHVMRPERVWFNGELVYFRGKHLLYALPALFCLLTFGLLPPVLLLCYPLLNKCLTFLGLEDNKKVIFICGKLPSISVFKPLFDSFQGCFKDNFRFFAGLYFLYRWCFPLVHFNTELSNYYTSIGGILVVILTLHTICQPYVKRVHNIIDTLLFSSLTLINFLLLFNYHKSRSQKPHHNIIVFSAVVQLVLIYLPLTVMCIYVTMLLFRQVAKCMGYKSQIILNPANANKWRELVLSVNTKDENSDTNEEEFTHDRVQDEYTSAYNYFKE